MRVVKRVVGLVPLGCQVRRDRLQVASEVKADERLPGGERPVKTRPLIDCDELSTAACTAAGC
jgi:hypothetical protein